MTSWIESIILNKKLGKLTPVKLLEANERQGLNKWLCLCDCGSEITILQHELLSEKESCSKCKPPKTKKAPSLWSYRKNSLRLYKINAAKRQLDWELTDTQALAIMSRNCVYCGDRGGGIDRQDNGLGYTESNSVPCCSPCNYMKSDMLESEFLSKVKRIYEFKHLDI